MFKYCTKNLVSTPAARLSARRGGKYGGPAAPCGAGSMPQPHANGKSYTIQYNTI